MIQIIDEAVAEALFRLIRHRTVRNFGNRQHDECAENYAAWRGDELGAQFEKFAADLVQGKDVLDFGCGSGALALKVSRLGARSVVGVDLSAEDIRRAIAAADAGGIAADFRIASGTRKIDFDDNSFDVILCFDVLEHIMEYGSIIREWKRVLRPRGRLLIWWCPYFHPYGHHLYRYAPVPWMHVFCSVKVMNMVCSKVVNLSEFEPPNWDFDEQGNRLDRFAGTTEFGHLNRLTIARFERLCSDAGFVFLRREFQPLTQLRRIPFADRLCSLPGVREFFIAYATYEIGKEGDALSH